MNLPQSPTKKHRPLALFALSAFLLTTACKADTPEKVHFDSIQIPLQDKGKPFTLEVADTEPRRELGLMNRESMPADHGMLFVFDKSDKWSFWMKNTLIPLDLLFLDDHGKIVGIHPLKPKDESYVTAESPARFAIELNAGTAKSLGLKVGDSVPLPEKLLKAAHASDDK